MPEIDKMVLSHQRADLVIGFQKTHEFREILSAHPSIQATAIEGKEEIVFPFILLEAKSEKDGIGFDSVERCAAFGTNALLALQRDLSFKTIQAGYRINPIVWLLASRGDQWGDQWGVYACVPDQPTTRMIKLWEGSIYRHDHSLQFLLIIEMLCDWARNILADQLLHGIWGSSGACGTRYCSRANSKLDGLAKALQ